MKILFTISILLLLQSCSFDNKTGIWKSETRISKSDKDSFKQFKNISITGDSFKKEINIKNNYIFKLPNISENDEWTDIFYDRSNNTKNFKYDFLNQKLFKSKKLTRSNINDHILYENGNIITSDQIGNINIFSLNNKKIKTRFNFYKKRFKKNIKKLNLIVENNIIYASDNLGYLYSFDYENNKILWAKNFKIPFRSNLKIFKDKLILSNQNNQLFFINKNTGDVLKLIPTEETIVKNKFVNNISLNDEFTFFLNTYGSLYSIDNSTMEVNWFLNLNQSLETNPGNLFFGNKLINNSNTLVVSTNKYTYIMDSNNGRIISKINFSSSVKPIIIGNYLFAISKNDLLISMNINKGEVIYSLDLNKKISEFLNTKKKKAQFKDILMANNKLLIFLQNSYVLDFTVDGNLENIIKLPSKLKSQPMIINGKMIYFDFKNKVSVLN